MDTRIYVITHKQFEPPKDSLYYPIHAGRALSQELGYPGDNTDDNISLKNKSYCELTALYYLWKNIECDIIGTCHYRRYFVQGDHLMSKDYVEALMMAYDVVTIASNELPLSVEEHYRYYHNGNDLDLCRNVISTHCPEYLKSFDWNMKSRHLCAANMMIMKKELFDSYCSWLFPVLFHMEKLRPQTVESEYNQRVYGFISERLLRVWICNHAFRVKEEYFIMLK